MPSIPASVLPHRARVVATLRPGPKNVQGEREATPVHGPWFDARLMSPRPREDAADDAGARRHEVRWVLLYGDEYEDGAPLARPPVESDDVEVERDGVRTRYVVGPRPRAFDTGEEIFGGQVELVEVA